MEISYDPDTRTLCISWAFEDDLGEIKLQLTKRAWLGLTADRRPNCVLFHLSKEAAANLLAHRPSGLIVIGEKEQVSPGSRG